VERFHTWPTIQRQTVADHTWNVLRIYIEIFGAPGAIVLKEIMFHDVGEVISGDVPYPTKAENPVLKKEVDRIEKEFIDAHVPGPSHPARQECLTQIKVCDLIEMYEFGIQEEMLGSRYAGPIVRQTYDHVLRLIDQLKMEERHAVLNYLGDEDHRRTTR